MTRQEFDKLYNGKAVWCKTQELANEFLTLADSVGYKWAFSGDPLLGNTHWLMYEHKTVYFVDSYIQFDVMVYAKLDGYEVVEFGKTSPQVFDADALAIELSAIHKHLSLIDEPISGLIDVVKVEDLPKVKELREHYEKMSEIIESLKGE